MSKLLWFISTCALIVAVASVEAMTSTNYMIPFDSMNSGGLLSTSSSYSLEDTSGEIATGNSTSTNYTIGAGYQQMNESYISISIQPNEALPSLSGISGSQSATSSTWLVITDNTAGYQLLVRASTSPALKSGPYAFQDYVSGGPDPDFAFTVGAASSTFGFSPEGSDIVQRFKDNGSACNAGSSDTQNACWAGFSTTPQSVSERLSANHPNGSTTTIRYRAGIGSSKIQESGNYSAEIIVTAVTL